MDFLTRSMAMGASGNSVAAPEAPAELELVNSVTQTVGVNGLNTNVQLTGIAVGDVVFAYYVSDLTSLDNFTGSDWDDWNLIPDSVPSALSSIDSAVWWKTATGSTESLNFNYRPTAANETYSVCMFAFRGLNPTDPYISMGSNTGNSTIINLPDYGPTPNFDTITVAFASLDDDTNVTYTPPSGYTTIATVDNGRSSGNNATGSIAQAPIAGGSSVTGVSWTVSQIDTFYGWHMLLVPDGADVTPPVISGPALVTNPFGGTSVATYTADDTVTWSLTGEDASLFSINSSGVLTYNTASSPGQYSVTINASNEVDLSSTLDVTIRASDVGTAGGGMSIITSRGVTTGGSDESPNQQTTYISIPGTVIGDLVFFAFCSNTTTFSDIQSQLDADDNDWILIPEYSAGNTLPARGLWYTRAKAFQNYVQVAITPTPPESQAFIHIDEASVSMVMWGVSGATGIGSVSTLFSYSNPDPDFSRATLNLLPYYIPSACQKFVLMSQIGQWDTRDSPNTTISDPDYSIPYDMAVAYNVSNMSTAEDNVNYTVVFSAESTGDDAQSALTVGAPWSNYTSGAMIGISLY